MRKRIILLSLIIFVFSAFVSLRADDFTDAMLIKWEKVYTPFFNKYNPFGAGARAIGMGEAFAAVADDAAAIYYNPAGLAQLDHNELFWTGGSYYKTVPYTDFATFTMALGTQYFGLSYLKPYHPIGRYPNNVVIPAPGVNPMDPTSLFYDPTDVIFIGPGTYEKWYGDLDAAQQAYLAEKYRNFINLPFQENQIMLTYATPLTADRSFNFGINIKYQYMDYDTKNYLKQFTRGDEYDGWAWALDVGFLYKLRMIEFLKDFNIGIMLRDVSGRIKRYKTGMEEPLYFTSSIALSMRTTELIEKEITTLSMDWDAVNDPAVLEAEKFRLKFGFEQWFFDNHFALRGGLINFIDQGPWRMSVGLSARYMMGIDYAYVFGIPFGSKAQEETDSHWVSVYWMWGKVQRKLPTPDVFAAVEPISFAPRNGETVMFKLNAVSRAGIDRWVLNILDRNNNLVKTYVDVGSPPSQIMWNGTDSKYQLLPDGEYTFIFEVTDKLGSTSSTPVQTVKIYTPIIEGENLQALDQLKRLLNEIKDRDVREDTQQAAAARDELERLKTAKTQPTPAAPPPPGNLPEGFDAVAMANAGNMEQPAPAAAGQQGPVNMIGFPNVESGSIRSAYIQTAADGAREFSMDYVTANTLPKYVMQEMALMTKSISESLGLSVDRIGINAVYGQNGAGSISMNVPVTNANNYTKGLISTEQLLRGANVLLNGERVVPNF